MPNTLNKRALGRSLNSGEIGLGCMGMSEFYGPSDKQQSLATLRRAAELGVTLFDTADMYGSGANEELLGEFIEAYGRDQIQIATKFGIVRDAFDYAPADHTGISNDPAYARASCEASLRRLGVDHIDLYYVHRVDGTKPIEEVMGALKDLVDEGKIGHIGLSEVSAQTLRRANAVHPIAAVQTEYSLWSREPETNGVLDACAELGTGLVAYSPLGRGFLTGALKVDDLADDDWRRSNPRFEEAAIAQNTRLQMAVAKIAKEKDCSSAQLLLAWLLAKRPFVVPIPGTKRVSYLEDNVGAANIKLSTDDVEELDALASSIDIVGTRYSAPGMASVDK